MNTNTPPANTGSREHIGWIDLLRICACFLVVLAHCCDPFVGNFGNSYTDFFAGTTIGSLVRPCVPLFAMISGVLLFPIKTDISTFYSKRLKRLLIPLVIWSLLLPLLYYFYFDLSGVLTLNPNIVADNYTWTATVNKMLTFPLNFNYDSTPLWYLYMLLGVYLIMPIIGPWVNQATQKDLKLFLKIWVITLFLPAIQLCAPLLGIAGYENGAGILGVCSWNTFGVFYYFSGFLGYIILAHYLNKYPLNWSWGKTLGICIPLFCVGYIITLCGFMEVQKHFPGDYNKLEITWWFCGINVFMMTSAVYAIFSKIKITPGAFMKKVAGLTLGIFLCHFVIVQASYDLLVTKLQLGISPFAIIPLMACMSFFASFVLCWVLSLTPFTRKSVI